MQELESRSGGSSGPPSSTLETAEQWVVFRQTRPMTVADERAFEKWLAADPQNAVAHTRALTIWRNASHLRDLPNANVLAAEARETIANLRSRRFHPLRYVAVLTAASIAIVVFILVPIRLPERLVTFRTGTAQVAHEVLPDGSTVELGPNSSLVLHFTSASREVQLVKGEIYFDVRHLRDRPFVVKVASTTIQDLGTKFDVYADSEAVEVSVAQGRVAIVSDGKSSAPILEAGSTGHLTVSNGKWTTRQLDPTLVATWRSGWLSYDSAPLTRVVKDFNQYSLTPIVIVNADIADLTIGGRFQTSDPRSFIKAISVLYGVQALEINGEIRLF